MRELNRSAIVVIPKQPFLEWLNYADEEGDDLDLAAVQNDPAVYLLPVVKSDEELGRFLQENCADIFEHQLEDWIVDDTLWPVDRGFEVFSRWFAVSFHSTIVDVE